MHASGIGVRAVPVLADEAVTEPFAFVSATSTITDPLPEGVVAQWECAANNSYPKAEGSDTEPAADVRIALEYIKDAELSYSYALGEAKASGMEMLLGIQWDGIGAVITAYKEVEGTRTELGSYAINKEFYYGKYKNYYIPFNEDLTGSGTLVLVFNNDTATNPDQWLGFSGFTFIDASVTVDAYMNQDRLSAHMIAGPDYSLSWYDEGAGDYRGFGHFGNGSLGDYVIIPNVDFGNLMADNVSMLIARAEVKTQEEIDAMEDGDEKTNAQNKLDSFKNAKVEVLLDNIDGEPILTLGYEDLKDVETGWRWVTFKLDERVGNGVHDICINFTYFDTEFSGIRFIPYNDATSIVKGAFFNEVDGTGVGAYADRTISHLGDGDADGEIVVYNVDFGEAETKALEVYLSAWNGDTDDCAEENSRIEVYAGSVASENLLGTIGYDELEAHKGGYYLYLLPLSTALKGEQNIYFVSYWQSGLAWFKFVEQRDAAERILAVENDTTTDKMRGKADHREPDLEYSFGWYGNDTTGETLLFNLIDMGETGMKAIDIRFNAWNAASDTSKNSVGRLEVYAGDALVATVTNEQLNQNIDRYNTYTVMLSETLTGVQNISVVSYWQGELAWFKFSDGTQDLMTSNPAANKDTGAVSLKVSGYTTAENVKVVFACYGADGRLVDYAEALSATAAQVLAGAECSASFDEAIPDGATVKAFVWNSIEGMKPLAAPVGII